MLIVKSNFSLATNLFKPGLDFIISVDGELFTCGANQFGQLGYQTDFNSKQAGQVYTLKDHKIQMVACGDTFTVAVSQGMNHCYSEVGYLD